MAKVKAPLNNQPMKTRPALTPEAREQQLISLAVDLVEKRLKEGTASSQETVHFLRLAASDYKLKNQRLQEEVTLLKAKTETLQAARHSEEVYTKAIAAMRKYSGHGDTNDDIEDDY